MDNCAVKCFVTWRPDGSTQTHPQLPSPWMSLHAHSGAGSKRQESIWTNPRWISHSIPNICTSSDNLQAPRCLAQVLFLNQPTSSQNTIERIRQSGFPRVPNEGVELEVPCGDKAIQCLENAEIFTLRYRVWFTKTRRGPLCCHFMSWPTPLGSGWEPLNLPGSRGRVGCPEISWDVGIQWERM